MPHVLITGGSGFLGRALAKKFRALGHIVILGSRDHALNQAAEKETGCLAVPLDVSNINSVRDVVGEFGPEIVVHAAAAKFVDVSEKNPMECVDTNILGSQNVVRVCSEKGVSTLVGISTDKAASPGNMYGFSKAVMERMFHLMHGKSPMKLACVRFGNIVWATGSVLPIWRRIYQHSRTIGATNMRRFFFTVDEASELVLAAVDSIESLSGKVLVRAMKVATVQELAEAWCRVHGGSWEPMVARPGDKIEEDLISETECSHAERVGVNGLDCYVLDFASVPETPLKCPVTTANSPALTDAEIRAMILREAW